MRKVESLSKFSLSFSFFLSTTPLNFIRKATQQKIHYNYSLSGFQIVMNCGGLEKKSRFCLNTEKLSKKMINTQLN